MWLNPRRGNTPAFRAEHRLTFLGAGPDCWLAGGSATLIPDFQEDQRPSCERSSGKQLQMWRAHTRAHAHTHTCHPCHRHNRTPVQKQISSDWSHQSDVSPPPPHLNSFSSNLRREGTCQRMLSLPASSHKDGGRDAAREQMNRERANNESNWRSAGHWWELA